jgi:hypothetical protein
MVCVVPIARATFDRWGVVRDSGATLPRSRLSGVHIGRWECTVCFSFGVWSWERGG